MIPKNYKVFKDNIADEVGVNQSVVDDLISFYYSKIRNSLSNIDDLNIYINLDTAQKMFFMNSDVSGYDVKVFDVLKIESITKALKEVNEAV